MDGILGIFESISSANSNNIKLYLKAINEHQSFRLNGINLNDPAIQNITAILSQQNTRYEGLLMLQTLLEQSSLEVIDQKGVLWASLCLKICNQRGEDVNISLAYDTIKILLEKSVDLPDLTKSFSSNFIDKICETLKYVNETNYLSALKCLDICLKIFPGPCGSRKEIIMTFLGNFIDSPDTNLVKCCAKCMHLMQQVRGGGMQGVNYKTSWSNYQIQLLSSLHQVLDLMYSNCSEVYDDGCENEPLKLKELDLSNEPVLRAYQLVTRFKNLLIHLIIAIREPFPSSKAFLPKKILNLVSRGLGINCIMLQKNPIFDNIAIGALLPEVHVQLLKVVNVLITTLKSHMIVYYDIILSFPTETLKWTSTGKSQGFRKPYGLLRETAFQLLSLWCKTMKFGSCCELIFETIIDQIIYNITPFQNEMTLKVLSGTKKHMTKKARRLLHKAQNEKSHLVQTHSKSFDPHNTKIVYTDQENQSICTAALECLKDMLLSCSGFLKPSVIKELQGTIIQICLQSKELYSINDKTNLYSNYKCRRALYDVLETIIISPHHLCPPPTQLAIQLMVLAHIKDSSPIIRDVCARHIRTIEKLLHPQKESLYFPPELSQIKHALNDGKIALTDDEDTEHENDVENEEEDVIINCNNAQIVTDTANEDNSDVVSTFVETKIIIENDRSKEIDNPEIRENVSVILTDSMSSNSSNRKQKHNPSNEVEIISSDEEIPTVKRTRYNDNKMGKVIMLIDEDTDNDDSVEIPKNSKEIPINSKEIPKNSDEIQNKNGSNSICEPIVVESEDGDIFNEIAASFVNELK